jgi:hypothetical protein
VNITDKNNNTKSVVRVVVTGYSFSIAIEGVLSENISTVSKKVSLFSLNKRSEK